MAVKRRAAEKGSGKIGAGQAIFSITPLWSNSKYCYDRHRLGWE